MTPTFEGPATLLLMRTLLASDLTVAVLATTTVFVLIVGAVASAR